jgi:hypothetical protein
LEGAESRKWNVERFLLFQMVVMQRTRDLTSRSRDIRKRLTRRMDAWEEGKCKMRVQSTKRDMQSYLSTKQKGQTEEQRAKVSNTKMLRGDVRGAVKSLTDTEVGGVLLPNEIDDKTGNTVEEVLLSKHPEARVPDASKMPKFSELPDLVELSITDDIVQKVASRLMGSAEVVDRIRMLSHIGYCILVMQSDIFGRR